MPNRVEPGSRINVKTGAALVKLFPASAGAVVLCRFAARGMTVVAAATPQVGVEKAEAWLRYFREVNSLTYIRAVGHAIMPARNTRRGSNAGTSNAMATRPPSILEIRFEGPGILPEKIPITSLARALSAVHRLAAGPEVAHVAGDALEEEPLRLLQVKRGSAVFSMGGQPAPVTLARLRETGKALEEPDSVGDRSYILSPIEDLSAIARALHCEIVLREPGEANGVVARIGPESYQKIARSILVSGETAFVGIVKRVGGATERRCALRVAFQRHLLYCRVESNELVRKLGQHLYEEVVVHGTAEWLKTSWQVMSFTITGMSQPKSGSLKEALEALREAGGKDWDGVDDPESFLEQVSGER